LVFGEGHGISGLRHQEAFAAINHGAWIHTIKGDRSVVFVVRDKADGGSAENICLLFLL